MAFMGLRKIRHHYFIEKDLDLLTLSDRVNFIVFIVSMVLCMAISLNIWFNDAPDMYYIFMLLSVPFFILGLMFYLRTKAWIVLLLIIILTGTALLYDLVDVVTLFFIDFVLVGAVGVVSLVVTIQKFIFYRVIRMTEYMNVKDKMTFPEKVVAFAFNIPRDLDTRHITMDYNHKSSRTPWKDILETIRMGLMIGIFLWIYLSMNPTIFELESFLNAPMFIFTIVLFIPVIVMPWSIFRTLNVRIETRYRDFSLYSGIKETLKRMVLPMFAAFLFLLTAVNKNGLMTVLGFVAFSVAVIIVIIVLTVLIYYAFFERKLVDQIISKWKVYRPVSLLVEIEDEDEKKDVYPGTPKRDTGSFADLELRD